MSKWGDIQMKSLQEYDKNELKRIFEIGIVQRTAIINYLKIQLKDIELDSLELTNTNQSKYEELITRLEKCSSSISAKRTKNGQLRYYPNYRCNLTRLCPSCRDIQLRRLFQGHANYLKKQYSNQDYQLLHITFSGPNNDDPGYYFKMMSLLDSVSNTRADKLPIDKLLRQRSLLWKSVETLISKYEYTLSNRPTRGKASKKLFYNHHIHSTMILPRIIDGKRLSQNEISDLIKGWFWKASKERFTQEDGSLYNIKFQCDIEFLEVSELGFGYLHNALKDLDTHFFTTLQHTSKVFDFHRAYKGDKRLVRKQFCNGLVKSIKAESHKGESMVDMETIDILMRDDFVESVSDKPFDLQDSMTSTNTDYHRHQRIIDLWGDFGSSLLTKEVNQQASQ